MHKKSLLTVAEIRSNFDDNFATILKCEEQIALTMRRKKISENLKQLKEEVDTTYAIVIKKEQLLQKEAKRLLDLANDENKKLTSLTTQILDHVQKQMAQSVQRKEEEQVQVPKQPLKPCLTNTATKIGSVVKNVTIAKTINFSTDAKKSTHNLITPKMSINEYKASPLVSRPKINRIPFMFLEFEVQLKQHHFDKISKYMRGRETLNSLNEFLEQVIIPCFNEKYQLLHRERSSVRNLNELELWKVYNEQSTLVPECHFITPADISRKVGKILDKKLLNRLTILRHVGLLQEKRIVQTTCYIWNARFI